MSPIHVAFDLLGQVDGTFVVKPAAFAPLESPLAFARLVTAVGELADVWDHRAPAVAAPTSIVELAPHSNRAEVVIDHQRWRVVQLLVDGALLFDHLAKQLQMAPMEAAQLVDDAVSAGLLLVDGRDRPLPRPVPTLSMVAEPAMRGAYAIVEAPIEESTRQIDRSRATIGIAG